MRVPPRNESQFIAELRESLNYALSELRVDFTRLTEAGRPDYRLDYVRKKTGKLMLTIYAEFKYAPRHHTALIQPWNLLREIQKVTLLNMAKSGLTVALVVCEGGLEAPWYILDKAQIEHVDAGLIPPCNSLVLRMLSRRLPDGRWSTGTDWGDESEAPQRTLVDNYLTRVKKGLARPGPNALRRLGLNGS